MSSKLALAALQPEESTAFVSPEWDCRAWLMPHGPVKKLTCSRSSPVLYGGASNRPWKKSSFPLPSGCVELPTTIRAAKSTRGAEIEAGWVAATLATVVATPTAAMPIAILLTRFVAVVLIARRFPKVSVATYRVEWMSLHHAVNPGHTFSERPRQSAPGRNRTCDLGIRRPLLYPTELRRQRSASLSRSEREPCDRTAT